MRRSSAFASAFSAVIVLMSVTPLNEAPAKPIPRVSALAPLPPLLQFDAAQAATANGPAVSADPLIVCGDPATSNPRRRFLSELLQGNPLQFKVPARLGDVTSGPGGPTSIAGKEMMVSGTVSASKAGDGKGDFPFDHPFGSDFNMDLKLDAPYAFISQVDGSVNPIDMHVELSAGQMPHVATPAGPPTGEAWESNSIRDSQNRQPGFVPSVGDRVVAMGRWINDCGHTPFQTELHALSFLAWAHTEGAKTVVQTFYAPYRETELYSPTKALANQVYNEGRFYDPAYNAVTRPNGHGTHPVLTGTNFGTNSFPGGLVNDIISLVVVNPAPFDHLESWSLEQANSTSPADWQICVPAGTGVLQANYDFVARPGVQITATPDSVTGCATMHTVLGTQHTPDPPFRQCATPWPWLSSVAAAEAGVPNLDLQAQLKSFVPPANKFALDPAPIVDCYDGVSGPTVSNNLTTQHVATDNTVLAPFWGRVELSWANQTPPTSTTSSSTSTSTSTTSPAQLTITVTPATIPQGASFKVSTSGWKPGSTVTFSVDGTTTVGTGVADNSGNLDASFTMPSSIVAGAHKIQASGTTADNNAKSLSTAVTVTAPVATTPPITGALPATGAAIAGTVAIGSSLVFLGLFLTILSRKRRPNPAT